MLTWEGSWPNSLVGRPPWLQACSVKNKTNIQYTWSTKTLGKSCTRQLHLQPTKDTNGTLCNLCFNQICTYTKHQFWKLFYRYLCIYLKLYFSSCTLSLVLSTLHSSFSKFQVKAIVSSIEKLKLVLGLRYIGTKNAIIMQCFSEIETLKELQF